MKVRGAVLTAMGLPAPYAQSRPLEIGELDLAPYCFSLSKASSLDAGSAPGLALAYASSPDELCPECVVNERAIACVVLGASV